MEGVSGDNGRSREEACVDEGRSEMQRSDGGGEQGWGAEIYVRSRLQLGSRGKQPGLL